MKSNMHNISICYLDDFPDSYLTRYLDNLKLSNNQWKSIDKLEIYEVNFKQQDYQEIFNLDMIKKSDIIILDSRLYENNSRFNKITGEQLQLLLQNLYPYKEYILITQNQLQSTNPGLYYVNKYVIKQGKDESKEFYDKYLLPILDESIKRVISSKTAFKELRENKDITQLVIDNVESILLGENIYSEITKEDIDNVVKDFERIKTMLDKLIE